MSALSLLQNYIKRNQNLSHNPKFNHTLNIYDLWAHAYLQGFLVMILVPALIRKCSQLQHSLPWSPAPAPQPSRTPWAFAHCPYVDSQIWAKLARLSDGFRFRSDQDPPCGHHLACHSPSCPPTCLLLSPLQWPEGLGEKLLLAVLCPSLCPAWCQPQAWVQWGTHGVT